jgi:dolichyl-phosphate beta-glucosyltransferase
MQSPDLSEQEKLEHVSSPDFSSIKSIDISIVIPAKDEEARLPKFLSQLAEYCEGSGKEYEIIVVDDGSVDRTVESAESFRFKWNNFHVLKLKKNKGKGNAVKSGMLRAAGHIVIFMDADGSTGLEAIEENLGYLDQGFDIVIGSRVVQDDRHKVVGHMHRKFMGAIFNFLVHTFLFKDVKDTQCGFKMFKRETARDLFRQVLIDGFGFDIELLYLACAGGYKVKEVPVNWTHVNGSRINLFLDSYRMFLNILQIRRRKIS